VTRQILNEPEITQKLLELCADRREDVQAWVMSTYRRYLLNAHSDVKRVFLIEEAQTPAFQFLKEGLKYQGSNLLNSMTFVDASILPEWATEAYNNGVPLIRVMWKEELEQWLNHTMDYLTQLPNKQHRHDMEAMHKAIAAWDKRLERQKAKQDLSVDVEVIELPDPIEGMYLVKCLTEGARKAEGAYMRHCVGDEPYGTPECAIYSLRSNTTGLSQWTFAVYRRLSFGENNEALGYYHLSQMNGRLNVYPSQEFKEMVVKKCQPYFDGELTLTRRKNTYNAKNAETGRLTVADIRGLRPHQMRTLEPIANPFFEHIQSMGRLFRHGQRPAAPEVRFFDTESSWPTGMGGLGAVAYGGLRADELTMFSAGAGSGKSMIIDSLMYAHLESRILADETPRELMILKPRRGGAGRYSFSWNRLEDSIRSISAPLTKQAVKGEEQFKLNPLMTSPPHELHNLSTQRWSTNPFNTNRPDKAKKP